MSGMGVFWLMVGVQGLIIALFMGAVLYCILKS